jgi:hypothetical protein
MSGEDYYQYGEDEEKPQLTRYYSQRQGWHHIGCDGSHPPSGPCWDPTGLLVTPLSQRDHTELDNASRMDVVDEMLVDLEGERLRPRGSKTGVCRGCGTDDFIDGYRLCRYCRELAGEQQKRESVIMVAAAAEQEPERWPWPLSVRSFLARMWYTILLLATGAVMGILANGGWHR